MNTITTNFAVSVVACEGFKGTQSSTAKFNINFAERINENIFYLVLFRKYSLGLSKGLWLALPLPPELRKSIGNISVFEENQQW